MGIGSGRLVDSRCPHRGADVLGRYEDGEHLEQPDVFKQKDRRQLALAELCAVLLVPALDGGAVAEESNLAHADPCLQEDLDLSEETEHASGAGVSCIQHAKRGERKLKRTEEPVHLCVQPREQTRKKGDEECDADQHLHWDEGQGAHCGEAVADP